MNEPTDQEGTGTEETTSATQERTYATVGERELGFDPLKDLNLPSSYQEMMERLGKLGGDRSAETLN